MTIHQIKQKANIKFKSLLNQTGIRKSKVFAIGFNKSGTSSLQALFKSFDRPSYHGIEWADCEDLKLLQKYDCFSDGIDIDGVTADIAKLDQLFPGSKFIMQVRDAESWIYSRLAHIERYKRSETYKVTPAWDTTEQAIKHWIRMRNAHHLFVLSYFSERPSDLLIVNFIQDELAATKVANFLGYKGEYQRPKRNVKPSKEIPLKHREMLERSIAELEVPEQELEFDIYCPSLESDEIHSRFPVDSSMLN
ncbi:hypothetical protein IQ255_01465 [Pleurocapsales cyanobacterium LEGE 10410]|nr:hypothetical protein [Pleurocapsales cyanobacterium LEGE 10410]